MFLAFVLAATSVSTEFFKDFGGSWSCGNGHYVATWSFENPRGDAWTVVNYGLDRKHHGGTAYVAYVSQKREYVYRDFHDDGALAELSSPIPGKDHIWRWKGAYYPTDGPVERSGEITWTLTTQGTILRKFAQNVNGEVVDRGSDVCVPRHPHRHDPTH